MPILKTTMLPAQQEQETDVFGILDQQYQREMKNLDANFAQTQEEMLRETRYKLKTLFDKYKTEWNYVKKLRIPADQKRQKLLQLNNKYELAMITAKSKVKPTIDVVNNQRQQTLGQLQQAYQQKQRDLRLVQKLVDDGIIQDPDAAKQRQYAMVGVSLPISAFRPPRELSMEEIAERQATISFQIINLEEVVKTATGEERNTILLQLADLKRQRIELMGVALPEYKEAIDKSNKLTNVGLQMQAGRKPGTLAEGIWQQKRKQIKPTVQKRHWAAGWTMPTGKKEETKIQLTPTELRAQGTKDAYEKGKKLGYWD